MTIEKAFDFFGLPKRAREIRSNLSSAGRVPAAAGDFSLSINVRVNAFGGRKGVGGNRQGSSPALIQKQVCTGEVF